MAVTAIVLLSVVALFVIMIRPVFLAGVLGTVAAIYLRPLHRWFEARVGPPAAAVTSLMLLLGPPLAVAFYGYLELDQAATHLREQSDRIEREIVAGLSRLPLVNGEVRPAVSTVVTRSAEWATNLPEAFQSAASSTMVALSVFLFTAFYVLIQAGRIVDWIRCRVAPHYVPLLQTIEKNATGALYGAVYATILSQGLKALVILALNLLFGVPLALTLALVVFVIGFFPVVGAWTVYLPIGVYILVFQGSTAKALTMVLASALICTGFISMFLRPKIAAGRSQVLDAYWMFLGLIAGVFAFGIPGIVAGPLIIALLKAMLDTLSESDTWAGADESDEPRAYIVDGDEVANSADAQTAE